MTSSWFVETEKQKTHAFLGNDQVSHTFRFNPDLVVWDYAENIVPYDTIGGRVLQVLSGKTNNMTINGRAGSRGEMQRIAKNCSAIMQYHIKTQEPVFFMVPSRQWNFTVYLQAVPQIGWTVAATSYPYQLILNIQDDLQGLKTQEMRSYTLERLAEGIGYNPDVHGGDAPKFEELVNSLQLEFNPTDSSTTTDSSGIETPGDFAYAAETKTAGTIDFSRRTGSTPDWVKQKPNLFSWNGNILQEDAMKSFQAICKKLNKRVTSTTSYRTFQEQVVLYNSYLAGTGNKAAKPGTSYHEIGIAIDMRESFYKDSIVVNTFKNNGWFKGVPSEDWHFSYKVSG